ncbi:PAC2 family protein [Halobellus inordinatus]|uniref:PAC2 family protein n=1 Tax=Halobellus inordinatus TaxID=1126236 RepID=UPI00210AA99B|nr:PAC2 family protein [Halobellus inordinatus]
MSELVIIEGLPCVDLIGKIATDHIINQLDMQYFGEVSGDELPQIALFGGPDPDVKPPVRLFADVGQIHPQASGHPP